MSRQTGEIIEQQAAAYLTQQGLQILDRNYHCRGGELDIVAKDGQTVVFIEVKFRKSTSYGEPFEQVSNKKQRRLIHAAMHYAQRHKLYDRAPMRFDVISVRGKADGFDIQWLKNAFTTDGF